MNILMMKKILFLFGTVALLITMASCGQNAQKNNGEQPQSSTTKTEVADDENDPKTLAKQEVVQEKSDEQFAESLDHIIERITKDILSLPEMKFKNASVMFVTEPSDTEPYYTFKGGSNVETHFATSFWFHVYTSPTDEIKVYDIVTDSEMTLEEWRNQKE